MKKLALVSLILLACQKNPEVSPEDRKVVAITNDTWKSKGLTNPGGCVEDVGIQVLHQDLFRKYCGIPADFSYGCVVKRSVGSFGHDKMLYISPAVKPSDREKAIASLTLHALCECTTNWEADKFDTANRRRDVWIESAGDRSVEAAVYSMIKKNP